LNKLNKPNRIENTDMSWGCEWDIFPQRGMLTSLAVIRADNIEYVLAHVLHSYDPSYR
jgi:hypothetical protein